MPVLLPEGVKRANIMAKPRCARRGRGTLFQPAFGGAALFSEVSDINSDLRVTDHIAARILSLPMSDVMTPAEVSVVCAALRDQVRRVT